MENALEVRGLRKAYPGFLLGDVSFSLPHGFIMALVGPAGAGKTSIVRLILGLARKDGGEVRILGGDAGDGAAGRQRVGFVLETPPFYGHLTARAMGRLVAPHYQRWDGGAFTALTEELEIPLGRRIATLSKGTRTKLALALALSHGAELIVMDEPTSGLDPVVRRNLLRILQKLIGDGRTSVLFSTHITSDIERVADYITFLQEGRLLFSCTREELRERWAVVQGPPELAGLATGPSLHGLRIGKVGFRVLSSDAAAARKRFGPEALVEPASLEDIMVHMGRNEP
jgi:ABC-2 type transport system ATP-binding protein